jgi:hypothetical protein
MHVLYLLTSMTLPKLLGVDVGKISYAITYPGASMQSSDLVHPI